ncbi:MAG: anthrone oxygenase family protein [Bacteroidota bacterium]
MQQLKQPLLLVTVILWAIIVGAIVYSHVSFLPGYLNNLPQSTSLLNDAYGIRDERFWMRVHPPTLLFTILTLLLNWKQHYRRKFILVPAVIYLMILVATATYFVPTLMTFAKSAGDISVPAIVWQQRGQLWERLSWVRGAFMFAGFICLLIALSKNNSAPQVIFARK